MKNSGNMRLMTLLAVMAMLAAAQQAPAPEPTPQGTTAASSSTVPGTALPSQSVREYQPITGTGRAQWYLKNTGGAAIGGSVLSAGWATAWGTPREYPATWEGFGKRYAQSLSGVAIANAAEVGLGALWGEDPRFERQGGNLKDDFRPRLSHVLLSTVTATGRNGQRMPAYARFVAIPGSSFLQNEWRPESQSSGKEAMLRTLYGFLGRMSANALNEFLPDLRRRRASASGPASNSPAAPAP